MARTVALRWARAGSHFQPITKSGGWRIRVSMATIKEPPMTTVARGFCVAHDESRLRHDDELTRHVLVTITAEDVAGEGKRSNLGGGQL